LNVIIEVRRLSMKLLITTEGLNSLSQPYESQCCGECDAEVARELLDEFLEAFARDPKSAKLTFQVCTVHTDEKA
jgi:hypothetical protein